MKKDIAELIQQIAQLPSDWHGGGSVNVDELLAIARHADAIGPIRHSMETGSGKTTLLFSHLSADHRAFAVDLGESVSKVRGSPLFRSETVTYVEGPTQMTLPGYVFGDRVQIALIDGPHGYPFPDLEYYYFYPIIETGGLLLVDDILIPSIRRMFDIIRADDMFELLEVVSSNLAIFRRTSAPLIDPQSDSWWLQGYNRSYFELLQKAPAPPTRLQAMYRPVLSKALHTASVLAPKNLKDRIPESIKRKLWNNM